MKKSETSQNKHDPAIFEIDEDEQGNVFIYTNTKGLDLFNEFLRLYCGNVDETLLSDSIN